MQGSVKAIGAVALLTALISACEPSLVKPDVGARIHQAENLAQEGNYAGAARTYEALAENQRAEQRDELLLRAAEQWYAAGDYDSLRRTLSKIEGPLSEANTLRWAPLAAELAVRQEQPEKALSHLAKLPDPIPDTLMPRVLALRGEALFQINKPVEAVQTLLARAKWLATEEEIRGNQRLLWNRMREASLAGQSLAAPPGTDPVLTGWLDLGRIAAQSSGNPFQLKSQILAWRSTYSDHPANRTLVDEILDLTRAQMQFPQQLALILPLSGRHQSSAEAVRDGFLASFFQHGEDGDRPAIRIYDANPSPSAAYQRALDDGADFVVGPLTKEAVTEVAQYAIGNVTVLTLNNLPDDTVPPANFYQFALAPEDEARQVAERAILDGRNRGIALVPNNDWGMRQLRAFADALQARGGSLLGYRFYDAAAVDFSSPITELLLLNESRARHRRLEADLQVTLEFQPRRRQDAQFIFLATRAATARLIRPQLRFHFAHDLPVYATSAAYEAGAGPNNDLNGIVFADMPWELAPDSTAVALRETLVRYWPDRAGALGRLYAMGFDAYRLVPLLHN